LSFKLKFSDFDQVYKKNGQVYIKSISTSMVPKKIINIYMNDPGGPNQTECENAPHDTMYE
jgi:hypothetical protein